GGGALRTPVAFYLMLSGILFMLGTVGVLTRKNAILIFMSVELQLNAVNLALVAFSRLHDDLTGQVLAFFSMVVAAAEVVAGLAGRRRRGSAGCRRQRYDGPRHHGDRRADARLCHRLHGWRSSVRALLLLHEPVRVLHADARPRSQLPRAVPRVGGRGVVLVP